MAWSDRNYTRMVGWLKIVLPLMALGLLSTVFLLSRSNEAIQDLPYAEVEIGEDGLLERVLRPSFAGATDSGDLITFVADMAKPVGTGLGQIAADKVEADIQLKSGGLIQFHSDTALMDGADATAQLQGRVVIDTSTGYRVTTEQLIAGMDRVYAETPGQVRGDGPPGQFTAGRMVIQAEGGGSDVQMRFTDRVKLLYHPKPE
ncbi:LPS export ABC transporter periplasmic protein LptC [Pseudooceanicola sp.]|uniref:LPS export ABC transporter periplasmic protein LptC n=1 Tax=Pseudooceanicola sp. TaxID=1914328 RepID=UPI00405801BE